MGIGLEQAKIRVYYIDIIVILVRVKIKVRVVNIRAGVRFRAMVKITVWNLV